ncbi:MAG: 4-(cytidine 5'-diphospho)-2-C-methyl-D-erythritol kinase [Singulisphaera sp.]
MIVRPVADGVEVLAPAKLNLFLEVLGRRPDGYHEVETLMVAVDLFDRLTFRENPSGEITLRCDDASLPTGSENLVVRAAERLRDDSGRGAGRIDLRKSIPAGAGWPGVERCGGRAGRTGSALGPADPPERLDALAGGLGSDVPFFLKAGAAICRGRGERVEGVELPKALHFALICPPIGQSTAEVYRNVTPPDRPRPIGPVLDALARGETTSLGRLLFNRLQPIAEAINPALSRVRDALADLLPSLDGSLMSGSGSAYFGLGRDLDAAHVAARHLGTLGLGRVRVVTRVP